jgi:hypothetical protein
MFLLPSTPETLKKLYTVAKSIKRTVFVCQPIHNPPEIQAASKILSYFFIYINGYLRRKFSLFSQPANSVVGFVFFLFDCGQNLQVRFHSKNSGRIISRKKRTPFLTIIYSPTWTQPPTNPKLKISIYKLNSSELTNLCVARPSSGSHKFFTM